MLIPHLPDYPTVTPLGTFFLDLSAGVDLESEQAPDERSSITWGIIRGIEVKLNNAS